MRATNSGGKGLNEGRFGGVGAIEGERGRESRRAIPKSLQVLVRRLARARTDFLLVLLDLLFVVCGYSTSILMRFGGEVPDSFWSAFRGLLPMAMVVHLVSNCLFGLYGQMWRHASAAEARHTALSWATSTAVLIVFDVVNANRVPVSVVLLGSLLTIGAGGIVRFQSRLFAFQRRGLPTVSPNGIPTVIIGAGEAAAALVRDLHRRSLEGMSPVVALDDDPAKWGRFLGGIKVAGPIKDLALVAAQYGVERVLLAIPSGNSDLVRRVAVEAEVLSLPVKVLPSRGINIDAARIVRDVEITDLLGREQVATDLDAVCDILKGHSVLITGAGGSIGSEIALQVGGCNPATLLLLDHDETHLHDLASCLAESSPLLNVVQVLVDIREPAALERIFTLYRPEVVFHAAAHKHVPLLENHPSEAVLTNVVGTAHLVRLSAEHGVKRFVFVSTDKAVSPISVMGASKQLGEQLLVQGAPRGAPWCVVRFGNVLGSRGSVVPTFKRQIDAGGPVTVTDRQMTRYFMSIPEAVQLVLQAAAIAEGGEIFMLEMGEPVSILKMAERMISLSGLEPGRDIKIRFTGIRPGEKLVEELQAPGELPLPTVHPSIVHLRPVHHTRILEQTEVMAGYARQRDEDTTRRLLFAALQDSPLIDLSDAAEHEEQRTSVTS